MAFIIPWIFRAGTKAKSAEVNENFLAVKQFIDLLEEDTATNQQNIEILENTKAGINGDATQRFQVANAIVDKDAVNKAMYDEWSINAKGYIDGFNLSYTSSSITASAGTCWSYNYELGEYEYIITTQALTETTSSLAANTTYYIFICADSSGINSPELTYTTNRDNPNYPTGLNISRRIGSFKTNNSSQIKEVLKEGERSLDSYLKYPNYTTRTDRNLDTTYTANIEGWVYIFGVANNAQVVKYQIRGLDFLLARNYNNNTDTASGAVWFPVSVGDTYRFNSSGLNNTTRGNGYQFYYVSNKP